MPAQPTRARTVLRRRRWGVGIGIVCTLLGLELGLRALLFSGIHRASPVFDRMRRAANFADPRHDDEFWRLHQRLRRSGKARPNPHRDEYLGWRRAGLDPESYAHPGRGGLKGRRPILLYGDSYAHCVTRASACWQGLVDAAPIGESHGLLNYGTAGYGLDQSYLFHRHAVY